jgi:hypothetical protein
VLLTRPFLYISGRDLIPEEETLTPEMMFNTLAPAGLLVMGAKTFLSPDHFGISFLAFSPVFRIRNIVIRIRGSGSLLFSGFKMPEKIIFLAYFGTGT